MNDRHHRRRLDVEVYTVPTDQPEADGTIAWDATTVVVARAPGRREGGARLDLRRRRL